MPTYINWVGLVISNSLAFGALCSDKGMWVELYSKSKQQAPVESHDLIMSELYPNFESNYNIWGFDSRVAA